MNEFRKNISKEESNVKVKAQDDFYTYVNYDWLHENSEKHVRDDQGYIVQIDDFRLVQDRVYHELDDIILRYIKSHDTKLSNNLKNYRTSVINMNPVNYSHRLGKESITKVDKYIETDNLYGLISDINRDEMLKSDSPIVWSLETNEKDSKRYISYISAHQFFIVDLDVYMDDEYSSPKQIEYKNKYRNAFYRYVERVFKVFGMSVNGKDIYDVEQLLFDALGCDNITKEFDRTYNVVSRRESEAKYGFDWELFCKGLGYKSTPPQYICSNLNYLYCCMKLLKDEDQWKSPKFRLYWLFIYLRRLIRITKKYESIAYDFYGKYERGQQKINRTDAVSVSLYMSVPFNTFLTNEYIRQYQDKDIINYVTILCEELRVVFRRILSKCKWMEPSTRNYALKKIDKFKFIIGKPDNLREDPDLNYGVILYDNMMKINNWRHHRFIELDGKNIIDIPMMDWTQYPVKMIGSQAYIVNASYTPT
ncbi:hypothetical protein EBX93_16080, partial [bacterium]|nr:hypothetical protein [bacterium]